MSQVAKFHAVVIENLPELPSEAMQGWIENPKAVAKVLAAFVPPVKEAEAKKPVVTSFGAVVVGYDQTLDQMIAAGRYDWKNGDITAKNFPVVGNGNREFVPEVVHFDRNISSDDAEKELDKLGFRAATDEELLAFGAIFPEVQRKFPIVALGSVALVGGFRRVVCLGGGGAGRYLSLRWRDDDWLALCRFLAVRK